MLRVFTIANLAVVCAGLALWLLPRPVLAEPEVESQIKGGRVVAREGRWSIFRMDDAPSRFKCMALHRSGVPAILYAEGLIVRYHGRGPVLAYSIQIDARAAGAPHSPWADPWTIALDTSEFRQVLGAKRLRIDAATSAGRILDDVDLTGVQEAIGILAGERCK